jgi:hypothetical protein
MKTKINIIIETKNVVPVFDNDNNLVIQMSQQIEQSLHTVIENWIKENINEETIIKLVSDNYYSIDVLESTNNIEDMCDLKVTYNDETVIDILRFIPPEEQIVQQPKLIDLEDKVVIPPMELDDGTEEEELEEYTEDEKNTENEPEEDI